ncbi:hypothetical protein Trihar35433_5511 [Trichoderma harzianum]|nr:hypothetical protein Trihar35433_5511 [Trichoderma harzianum]
MTSFYTGAEGCPYPNPSTSVQVRNPSGGVGGLVLLQDTQLIETLAHFNRERIPERVVHAKAAGAYGEFECTHDCTDITSASFLNTIGKKSDVLLRISTVGPERGSADTTRDVHGWGMKIYTDEGNQDFVCNNIPVFFVRDPIKFPSLNRSHKRHPQTNLADSDMFWDFHLGNPEGIHALMHLFNDRGTPASLRNINAYSGHTYKFTKEDGSFKYIKLHLKAQDGVKNFTAATATKVAGENPDFLTQDLFEAIEQGNFPKWDVFVQVMDPKEAETYKWNIFDMTKVWPHKDYPLRQIGVLTMNRNPQNYFTDIEQAAFSPSTMVPGIAPSADPNNYGADPNYVNSSLKPTTFKAAGKINSTITEHEKWVGEVSSFTSEITPVDFEQATALWHVLGTQEGHQDRFINNLAGHLSGAKSAQIRSRVYEYFSYVDKDLSARLREVTEAKVAA